MKYVDPGIDQAKAEKLAIKFRRPKTFMDVALSIAGGDPGQGAGFGAIYLLLSPITYPLYLIANRPHNLEWLRLVYWPFYEIVLNVSTRRGIKKATLWVEGTDKGLLLGLDKWGKGIWTSGYLTLSHDPVAHPLVVEPRRHLNVRKVSDGTPVYEGAIQIPTTLDPDEAADYIEQGARAAARGEDKLWVSDQFMRAYGVGVSDLESMEIQEESGQEILYPFWAAKYTSSDTTRYLAIPGVKGGTFARIDISNPVFQNEVLKEALSAACG